MMWLGSLVFNLGFYVWTAFMMVICLPILVMPRRTTFHCQRFWARGVLWMMRACVGVKVEIHGQHNLPAGACIVAAKHQSAWDTLIWHVIVEDPAMIMKRELLMVPLYGWYSRKVGMIAVDRSGGAAALRRMLRQAEAAAAQQRPIVIFPEGTRTAPGETRPYQPGVVALYGHLDLPVVPVALNSGHFWPRRRFLRKPGTIQLEYLEAMPPGLERRPFVAALENRIEAACARLQPGEG